MTTRNLLLFLWLAGLSLQQPDILKDFCRLFGHQTAVIDRKLYVDGGFVNYNPLSQYPNNESNTALLFADFDVNNQGMPALYDNLTKPADAPDVNGGILWPDTVNKMIYLYGGQFSKGSPENFSLWSYDALYNKWNTVTPDSTQANIQRASYGAGVALQDRAAGFYYGGWLSNLSVPDWGSQNPQALSSFLQYDMLQNTWTNSSGPDTIGRAEGAMVYIPASEGMLVYIGGVQAPSNNGTTVGQPMDEILLYDISGSKWYTQKATGQIPERRRKFCAGVTWAQDYSSYNIYLYGGLGAPDGIGFDEIYILTLPSFKWIKWFPVSPGVGYPKNSMSCTVIDGAQMLVMGGTLPNSTSCDVPPIFGMHNMYLGKQNPQDTMWAQFRSNLTSYDVPSEIISAIGGSATGGATTTAPADGFDNRDLEVFFSRTYTAPARTPTREIPTSTSGSSDGSSKSKPVGAIVGGVVGGVAGVSLLAALGFFYLRLRKKKQGVATELEQAPQDTKDPAAANPDDSRRSELAGGYPGQQERSELAAGDAGQRQSTRSELGSAPLVELEGDTAPYSSPSPSDPASPLQPISPVSPHRGSAPSP
ncbi:hypothetical protein BDV26DRAFT_262411 [Aspergillus bertholletiae]|uniref:Kelch repeat protein n=1 Tax=Aspergillus bertholletiae TaxID=1226010 RepID=A0A5N7B8I1_9EURO|nr:hypothetical protein BDV26DRAFT_262411 [Aspergillus bertholletiae]